MKAFNLNEMETIFEIGRTMQLMCDEGELEIFDSKQAFITALQLAMEFEKIYPDTEDYYSDIEVFIADNIPKEFEKEE